MKGLRIAGVLFGIALTAAFNCGPAGGDDAGATGGGSAGGSGGGAAGGSAGGSADAGLAPTEFCARYPEALCALKVACGLYGSQAACITDELPALATRCYRVDAGALGYRASAAEECLAELATRPPYCTAGRLGCLGGTFESSIFFERPAGCGAATCAPGTACDFTCASPTCRPLRKVGESCDSSGLGASLACDPDAGYCRADDGGFSGATARCRPFLDAGAPCRLDACGPRARCDPTSGCVPLLPQEAACTSRFECLEGPCRPSDSRCGPLPQGARCLTGSDCGAGVDSALVCVGLTRSADGGLADAGVCGPRPTLGQPCSIGWAPLPISPCRYGAQEACLDGQCRKVPHFTAPLGAECMLRPFGVESDRYLGFGMCAAGLACLPAPDGWPRVTGRCQPAVQPGERCGDEFVCQRDTCVSKDGGFPTCQPRSGLGEPCFGACLAELVCLNPQDGGSSSCSPRVATGGVCPRAGACATGYCELTCRPFVAPGSACTSAEQCESARCFEGRCDPPLTCLTR